MRRKEKDMKKFGFLVLLCCLGSMIFAAGAGDAQKQAPGSGELGDYPNKPITCIIPAAAGGGNDSFVRTVQKFLKIKQPIVVLNVPGGANLLGAMQAYNSPNDGYTLLGYNPVDMINLSLTGQSQVEIWKGMEPIACLATDYNLVSTNKASGFKTLEDMVAYAKAHPGELKWGTTGARTLNVVATYEVLDALGITDSVTLVPYDNGTQAQPALMGNHVQVLTGSVVDMRGGIESGDYVPLLVISQKRIKSLPNVPITIEKGIKFSTLVPRGFFAPRGTSEVQLRMLETAFKEVFENPEFVTAIEKLGIEVNYIGRDEQKRLMQEWHDQLKPQFDRLKN
jgi:tripartite-type tricarboxylate transporter receptor subunit TctC